MQETWEGVAHFKLSDNLANKLLPNNIFSLKITKKKQQLFFHCHAIYFLPAL